MTSQPSNQVFTVEVSGKGEKYLPLLNSPCLKNSWKSVTNAPESKTAEPIVDLKLRTPYELVVDGEAEKVSVVLGNSCKTTYLNHSKTIEQWHEPIFGLSLGSKVTESIEKKTIHFDTAK